MCLPDDVDEDEDEATGWKIGVVVVCCRERKGEEEEEEKLFRARNLSIGKEKGFRERESDGENNFCLEIR